MDRQQTFSGTKPVEEAHRFDEDALETYLTATVAGFAGPLKVSQFKGGQSNPTYRLSAKSGEYVLRRRPPGKLLPSAHAVDREFRVISALHPTGFPVARPHVLCEDANVIGTAFYVMDFVDGMVIWNPHIPGVGADRRAGLFDALNRTIAALHMIDVDEVAMSDFGKPEGYVARQIRRWSGQYEASATQIIPEMDRLMQWLPVNASDSGDVSLVHGDFRLDNCVVHPQENRILAVLDWELCTLGDPVADFTYHLMQWLMPPSVSGEGVGSLVGHLGKVPGIPAMDDYIADYCRRTERQSIENIDTYLAYNFFRLAAIYQGIVGRVRDGTAANPNAAKIAARVRPVAEVAWRYAEKAGA